MDFLACARLNFTTEVKEALPLGRFNPLNDRFAFFKLDSADNELKTLFSNIRKLRIQD